MKSNVLFPVIIGLFVIGGGAYFLMQDNATGAGSVASSETTKPTGSLQAQEPAPSTIVLAQNAGFTYENYTDAAFADSLGNEAFAVFVHSRSCGTCAKKNEQIMTEIEQFTDGKIFKMEYDEAPQSFIETYAVTKYDTFVVFDSDGNHETIKGAKVEAVRSSIQ